MKLQKKPRVRLVTNVEKNDDGNIIALCNPRKKWSPRMTNKAIKDIEKETFRYCVKKDNRKIKIKVVKCDDNKKYLRTCRDASRADNLGNLNECGSCKC